ncbi:MAG: TonB-dependent receptor [Gemmatimonadaceae bacterium]|nr:TonB-dependent receptor [Gemmatimonadaceae bacterium]
MTAGGLSLRAALIGALLSGLPIRADARVTTGASPEPSCLTRVSARERAALWAAPLDRAVTLRLPQTSLRAALDALAERSGVSLSYSAELLPVERTVCMQVEHVPLGAVLDHLLQGAAMRAVVVGATDIVLAPVRTALAPAIAPRAGMSDRPHIARTPSLLDRVVVTGSPDGFAQRGSPFALDVVEGDVLSAHGVRTLGDALELSVPGVWMWATSAGSVSARFGSIRGASSFGVTAPKVYVDGVEVANPLLVMQLDATRIARVEIIRGPQGAALYGADAISGVVHVLTRYDGTSEGQTDVHVASMAGVTNAGLVARDPFVQDHAVTLRRGTAARSISAGVNLGTVGEFQPGAAERRVLADVNARYTQQRAVWNGLARFTRQETNGGLLDSATSLGFRIPIGPRDSALGQQVSQYTAGGSVSVMPSLRWTHTFIAGVDGYALQGLSGTALPGPVGSTTVSALGDSNGSAIRLTTRLRSVGRFDIRPGLLGTLTLGAEQVHTNESVTGAPDLSVPSVIGGGLGDSTRNAGRGGGAGAAADSSARPGVPGARFVDIDSRYVSRGLLVQGQLAWRDTWYLSAGGRVERTTGATPLAQTSLLPMLGAAHVRELGSWTVKTRAAFGTGIRPARTVLRSGTWMGQVGAGNAGALDGAGGRLGTIGGLPLSGRNARALDAERQRGVEYGVDLHAGTGVALHLTRFDQRADGLIQAVPVITNTLTGSGRVLKTMRYSLQNVGAITNRGWEMEGQTRLANLTLAGTLTLVDSRVAQVARGYAGELRAGDRMFDVPASTVSLSASWSRGRWALSSSVAHAANWLSYDRASLGVVLADSTDVRPIEGAAMRNYWTANDGVTRWRANVLMRLRGDLTAVLAGDNLLNVQGGAPDNTALLMGRTITFGLRTRF